MLVLALVLALGDVSTGCDEEEEREEKVYDDPLGDEEGGEEEGGEAGGDMDFTGDEGADEAGGVGGAPAPTANPTVRAGDPKAAAMDTPAGRGDAAAPSPGSKPKRVDVQGKFLKVEHMLDRQDVRTALKYDGTLELGDLAGQPPTKTYNAVRLASESGFGVALQVWKSGSVAAAQRHFDQLYRESMGGQRSTDAGDTAFRTDHHGLISIVFLDKRKSTVAWLTCETRICSFDRLGALAQKVQARL